MKKASKAIAFAMASAMAVSMAACGGSASSSASGATTDAKRSILLRNAGTPVSRQCFLLRRI